MNRITLSVACLLVAVLHSVLPADSLDPVDDTTAKTSGQPITWEPMIVHLSASGEHGKSSLVNPPTSRPATGDDVIGEANQWLALKPLIQPHKGGIDRTESVICAWERVLQDGKPSYVIHGSGAQDGSDTGKIHSIFAQEFTLCFPADFDILMNATPSKKDQLLKEFFKISDLVVTAHFVSPDPTNFRVAVEDNAPKYTIWKMNFDTPEQAKSFPKLAHNFNDHAGFTWSMASDHIPGQVGVYEIRVKLTVEGRVQQNEDPKRRTVEGAIRIAVVNDTKFEVRKLAGGSYRKPGEKDLVKKGKIIGTTQTGQ